MKAIADTGFLVAFLSQEDRHHAWAAQVAGQLDGPALTCEAVLAETAFHLRSVPAVLEMVRAGLIELAFDCEEHWAHLDELAKRYADRQPDLADLCLIRMSELHPHHQVLTVDRDDFRIYRRNKRETIPVIFPPETR